MYEVTINTHSFAHYPDLLLDTISFHVLSTCHLFIHERCHIHHESVNASLIHPVPRTSSMKSLQPLLLWTSIQSQLLFHIFFIHLSDHFPLRLSTSIPPSLPPYHSTPLFPFVNLNLFSFFGVSHDCSTRVEVYLVA